MANPKNTSRGTLLPIALWALSRNVVSAKPASPSGAGFAIAVGAADGVAGPLVAGIASCAATVNLLAARACGYNEKKWVASHHARRSAHALGSHAPTR